MNNKIVGICLGVLLTLILFSNTSLAENSNQSFDFVGDGKIFNFSGQNTEVLFKAKKIHFTTNETLFNHVNNITIESNSGELKQIDRSPLVKLRINTNIYRSISIDDIDITLFFNSPMSLNYNLNHIEISGYMNSHYFKPNGGEVTLNNGGVDNVFIGDEEITDFRRISFKMDNISSIKVLSNNIELDAFGVSDLIIIGKKLSTISTSHGEGILRLDNHLFDIKNADVIDIEVLPTTKSSFRFDGVNIIFSGFTNSAKLNNEDKIMNDVSYWFEEEPEKIIALSSVISAVVTAILLILTALNMRSAQKLVSMETDKKKHEMQRFLNILLAELETNILLLDDLKKSVQTIIDDISELYKFEFLGFKDDGFNTFRNQGGFEYISSELYSELVDYYNRIYRISKKFDLSNELKKSLTTIYIRDGEPIKDIEDIETFTNNLKIKLKDEMKYS
ncbi:MAG: hypothetical protein KAT05_02805 [Spirochaetes bacterium]|nr:hypothetical protein [Spirochaetota bacterium]